ncbi:hypothetical protein DFH01_17455 [Falsiroseomonas bella]|uniref:PepSY domain-containing protein n=1 Tax=Falsiroseomonas bella TaxID=2184016 RepID=A0A317FBX2_9PROT|nr:PepSY domain-containing protein [Falsiroseomonas bella]PWS35993.1 hypothetical protein DFH01_17455 [Falsiroseomonas bella]
MTGRILRCATLALCGALMALPAAGPARADDDDCRGGGISRAQAIQIARSLGMVRVQEVECDDDEWEVEGRDPAGREMEVEIDRRTGRVIEVERD